MKTHIAKLILTCIVFMFMGCAAQAKPQIVSWTWPTTDCDGLVMTSDDLIASDLIYSTTPMPMPSDIDGPCAVTPDPDAPASAISVSVPIADTSVILNLKPGETYFARIRVIAYVAGNSSAWSAQKQFTIPYGRPDRVILSNNWFQWEAELIKGPGIRLN